MDVAPGVGYGLAAAVAWGVLLFVRKRLFPALPATVFMAVAFAAGAVLYLPAALALCSLFLPGATGLGVLGLAPGAFVGFLAATEY